MSVFARFSTVDPVYNPYSPGAGRRPAALVGRDRQQQDWRTALDRVEIGRSAQPVVLYGLRGVGKTVLLSSFRKAAADREWIVAQVEAGADRSLRAALGEALHAPLSDLARPSAGARLMKALKTALSFKASYDMSGSWNFGLDLSSTPGGGADTGTFETDLRKLIADLAEAAAEEHVGLAILIDEAQDLPNEEISAICAIAHSAAQDDRPALFAFAGLPSLPRILAEAKSYSERFNYESIEALAPDLAREAISGPSLAEGVGWDADAVEFLARESGGYPYFLQQYGQDTWNAAEAAPVGLADARVGAAAGRAALDAGFFRARWDRATPTEKSYLRAMAVDGDGGSGSGEVATRLNRRPAGLGPIRANLIAKGLVYAPEHGVVAYTVPGMASFIDRQHADL